MQTVVVFVEGVENGTLTLPSQMVDLYKRKMDRFVQTTKMAARLLSVVGVSLTLNDVIDMNEKINLVTMPGKYNTKSERESVHRVYGKHCRFSILISIPPLSFQTLFHCLFATYLLYSKNIQNKYLIFFNVY